MSNGQTGGSGTSRCAGSRSLPPRDRPRLRLRLLATSDIHATILPYDYAAGRQTSRGGLARVASLIARARAAAPGPCLLFDNGDFLQGTPLGDLNHLSPSAAPHPVIAAMNRLGYDGVALGNHEFNFGLDALREALAQADFPVICANALIRRGASVEDDETLLPPALLIERDITDQAGANHTLCIGVLGLVPPQITTWDKFHLGGRITARDMVETAAARVPQLRAEGADIVVLLAHTGIETGPPSPDSENAALALARIPGVDAVIAGHSHEVFPRPGATGAPAGADHTNGTFSGVPAVMPGFRASHLGVIDLGLVLSEGGWAVSSHEASAWPVEPDGGGAPAPADPGIVASVQDRHTEMLARMQSPLGRASRPIHSYLSRVRCDLPVRLVAEAQRQAVAEALSDGPFANLPVVSAAAPFHTGGRAGPYAFSDIPAGPLTLRNAADLQPFPNTLCALRVTGAELRDWLERAVSCYCQIRPGRPDQPLWNPRFPGHAADTIAGLSYRIDLTRPPLYDEKGAALSASSDRGVSRQRGRIVGLHYQGTPVAPQAWFVLAVSNYRASGGGPYPALPEDRLVLASTTQVRDVLADFIRNGGHERLDPVPTWTFLPVPAAWAAFETGPGLLDHPGEIAALGLTYIGATGEGFLRMRMPLFATACESAV